MKLQTKKIIAREIILLFCGLGILLLTWGFLVLRDVYFNHKINSSYEDIKSLQSQLNALPTDYLKEFYDLTSKYFVVNFKLGKDTYAIPWEQEKDFLADNGSLRNINALPIHSIGYSYFKYQDPSNILDKDSAVVFDYVPFNKFREFVASDDYKNKLFFVFSSSPDQNGTVTVNSLIDNPRFDPMKPHNGIFDLGTLPQFRERIRKGLAYNEKSIETKQKIVKDIEVKEKSISHASNNILSIDGMKKTLFVILIIIAVLLYPIRLSVYSVIWAIKTIK